MVSLAAVAGMLMVLTGVASATPLPAVLPPPVTMPVPGGQPAEAGRQPVGTVEAVEAALTYLDPGRSLALHYPGAGYVKVHLRQLRLLPGDYVTVADPQGQEVHRYEADPLAGADPSPRWAMSVTGDTAVVTLHVAAPAAASGAAGGLGVWVDRVAHGFAPGDGPQRTAREETTCGRSDSRDAVCYRSRLPALYHSSRAVVRLLIDGMQMCTAFRVGPGNRLLTNNHCLTTTAEARDTEVWFDYQCVRCGGWAVRPPTKVRGSEVLATDRILDYTLFTVDNFAEVERFGYLRLETGRVRSGEEIYIPQHPGGAPTRIAVRSDRDPTGNCLVAGTGVHGYGYHTDLSYYCDTEAGSSGSPVLSRADHRVIALHHFGGCPNTGVRMELIYPRIARHLPRGS